MNLPSLPKLGLRIGLEDEEGATYSSKKLGLRMEPGVDGAGGAGLDAKGSKSAEAVKLEPNPS